MLCYTQYASKFGKRSSGHRTGKGRFSFQSQRSNAKEWSKYHTITLISLTSKVMLKILQARLQQYMNRELPDVQAGFRKDSGTKDQVANIYWVIEKSRNSSKPSISALLTILKPLTVYITTNCGKFLKKWEYRQPYLPRDKPVCQSKNNRTRHGTMDWFQIGKAVHQGCILSAGCLFNL